jgi:acyl carrier protein
MTPPGTIARPSHREQKGEQSMPSTETSPQVVEEVIFDAVAAMGPDRAEVKRSSTFQELDLDSLDLVEIAQIVEEKWGLEFDPQDFADFTTVGEALDLVLSRMP